MLKHTLLSITPLLILSASAIAEPSNKVKNWVGGIDHLGLLMCLVLKCWEMIQLILRTFYLIKKQPLHCGELRIMKNV